MSNQKCIHRHIFLVYGVLEVGLVDTTKLNKPFGADAVVLANLYGVLSRSTYLISQSSRLHGLHAQVEDLELAAGHASSDN